MPALARLQDCSRAHSPRPGDPMSATRTALTRPAARSGARGAGRPGLRALPQVNAVMEREDVRRAADRHGRRLIAALLRERLASLRGDIRSGRLDGETLGRAVADLPDWIEQAARVRTSSSIRPVVNATGVVLHTNLGRAVLPEAATRRMAEVARSYTTLEYD